MRAFLGVPLPPFEQLAQLARQLEASEADLKVVDPTQFHLTIKFMGEVRPELAETVLKTMRAGALPKPFDVVVKDVGAFPNLRKPNILWAGLEDPSSGLASLHAAAEQAWVGLGQVPEDRGFSPHLTLARKRTDQGIDAAKALLAEYRELVFGSAHVDRANLYRSTLTPEGPVYEVVEEVRL